MNKKITKIICTLLSLVSLVGCNEEEPTIEWNLVEIPGYTLGNEDTSTLESIDTNTIRFHYSRDDVNYSNWSLWCWDETNDSVGNKFEFTHYDEYGVWGDVCLKDLNKNNQTCNTVGFLVAVDPGGTWADRDIKTDRFVSVEEKTPGGIQHVYILSGFEQIYESRDNTKMDTIKNAYVTDIDEISVNFGLRKDSTFTFNKNNFKVYLNDRKVTNYSALEYDNEKNSVVLKFRKPIDITKEIRVTYKFSKSNVGEFKAGITSVYDSEGFASLYTYSGNDLGVSFDNETNTTSTTFKVWAPTSSKMKLNIYSDGDPLKEKEPVNVYEMKLGNQGVWSHTIKEDLHGKYYTYTVTNSLGTNEVVDPYAKSCGINGLRGMVVNFSKLNKEIPSWKDDVRPAYGENGTDASIYEIHVRDMTIDPDSGVSKEKRGTFAGLAEKGTSYTSENGVKVSTGLEHLKELGITHVQILPLYDYNSVEERNVSTDMSMEVSNSNYNWGYDPLNYNCLEGSYSTNPYDGFVRIKEFKEMVMAMHSYGINVIMDVVYNHTARSFDSNFHYLVPYYYHRTNSSGELYNGSGCGNEVASDRSMVNKFIVDSTKFWVDEYHLSGYRFDLMGLVDNQTMIDVYNECHSIYDKVMIYGEPWTGGDSKLKTTSSEDNLKNQQTIQKSLGKPYFAGAGVYVGAFNDVIRNGIRGDNSPGRGWINGSPGLDSSIYSGSKGLFYDNHDIYRSVEPQQVINYVACHDNYTLNDQLIINVGENTDFDLMYKQAETIIFTCQGVPFLQEGEDFKRTKVNKRDDGLVYDHNSYNSCDLTNHMDWSLKAENIEMFNYFKSLIEFRKNTPEFTLPTREEVNKSYTQMSTNVYLIGYKYSSNDTYYVLHSIDTNTCELDGEYEIVFSNSNRVINKEKITSIDLIRNESVVLKKIK